MENIQFVYAGSDYATYEKAVPAPVFRKCFSLGETPENAFLLIGATGFYELYLNGKRITKGYLSPFISNPDQVVFFDQYDLTDLMKTGENTLDVLLGNGFSNPVGGSIWGHTNRCVAPSVGLRFTCGEMQFTARDMLWKRSSILFDDYRVGVYCDMRLQEADRWQAPQIAPQPLGQRRMTSCEPVLEIRRIRAKEICSGAMRDYRIRDPFAPKLYHGETVMEKTPTSGGFIYDFGENNSGVPCLKIKGTRGQKIHMQFSELRFEGFVDYINVDVYPDGCCQRDVYICGSDEEEIFIPPFTYHGFRYCYVYGITPEQATEDLLVYVVLHNDVAQRASFRCSDEISNQIFDACRRSDESNLVQIITDCPHREKNGWTGDIAISAEYYLMNLAVENCMRQWLHCVRQAQGEEGNLPLVVPSVGGLSQCPVWDSALFQVPYYIYLHTGNTCVIEENADSMMKNLRYYMNLRDERGIVECGLGDWLPVEEEAGVYHSPLGYTCSVILMECCRMGEIMMRAIGRQEDAGYCKLHRQQLRQAVREEYNENGVITPGKTEEYRKPMYRVCQTSQALGLYAGVFEESEMQNALDSLIDCIHAKTDSFDCGFLGLRVLFYVLTEHGFGDLAYYMITKPTHPSYANMIYRGETTVWERFAAPGKRIGSHNHHFMADVSAWYLRCVAGIWVNPEGDDPDRIKLKPCFIRGLDQVEASYCTPHGKLFVAWHRSSTGIKIEIRKAGAVSVQYDPSLKNNNVTIIEA